MTLDQLRWIYSNYTVNKLKATGWNASALPNSDNSDSTHLWSELCQVGTNCTSFCPPNEIDIIGPPFVNSDVVSFLLSKIITDAAHGEYLDVNRYTNIYELGVLPSLSRDSYALGLLDYALFNRSVAFAASIQATDVNYYAPCTGTLQNGLYPLRHNIFMDVASSNATLVAETKSFAKLIFSSTGDSIVAQNGSVPLSNMANSVEHVGDSCSSGNSTVDNFHHWLRVELSPQLAMHRCTPWRRLARRFTLIAVLMIQSELQRVTTMLPLHNLRPVDVALTTNFFRIYASMGFLQLYQRPLSSTSE